MDENQAIMMVDLVKQYHRLESEIDAAMKQVLHQGNFIQGKEVRLFEQELAAYMGNSAEVIGCGNGTDALQLAFMALDLPKNAEVILPAFTYAALAEVVMLLDLKPVFVDVDIHTYLIDIDLIEAAITSNTRAIAVVHLFGQMANMDAVMGIAKKHHLFVVEDAAQAIGSYYNGDVVRGFAGTIGDAGTTSFFPSKNLGCYGDGGAVFTKNKDLAKKISSLANHGQNTKYYHEWVGINSRLDTLQAAILRVKLQHLQTFTETRQSRANDYRQGLQILVEAGHIILPELAVNSTHVYHQFTLRLVVSEKREALRKFLLDNGIPSMVYYPLPLHHQNAYRQEVELPVSEGLCESVLSLPICPELSIENQQKIIDKMQLFFAGI